LLQDNLNILYSILGQAPTLSTGGPRRIVALILDEFKKINVNCISPYLLTNQKIIDLSDVDFSKSRGDTCQEDRFTVLKNRLPKNLFKSLIGRHRVSRINLFLDTYNYNLKTKKRWNQWNRNNENIIFHSHTSLAAAPFIRIRNRNNQKIIITYNSKGSLFYDGVSAWGGDKSWFRDWILRTEVFEMQNADVITFPSKGALDIMKSHHPNILEKLDTRIIHNGVDLERIASILSSEQRKNDDIFRIINVAQHVEQKRIDLLLKAVSVLKDEIKNLELYSLGDGPLLLENIELAKSLGLEKHVTFFGARSNDEVIKQMNRADVFVMPSENVIFDLVTLEAMAVGLPVIVSANGGNIECVRDGIDGILTKTGDVASVISAIRFVFSNREKARQLAQSAQERVSAQFSSLSMTQKYIDLYRELTYKN